MRCHQGSDETLLENLAYRKRTRACCERRTVSIREPKPPHSNESSTESMRSNLATGRRSSRCLEHHIRSFMRTLMTDSAADGDLGVASVGSRGGSKHRGPCGYLSSAEAAAQRTKQGEHYSGQPMLLGRWICAGSRSTSRSIASIRRLARGSAALVSGASFSSTASCLVAGCARVAKCGRTDSRVRPDLKTRRGASQLRPPIGPKSSAAS